jgi:toxin YoeB
VLVSASDWRAVEETLHLPSVPGMRESILEGMRQPGTSWRTSSTGEPAAGLHQGRSEGREKLAAAGLKPGAEAVLAILSENPYQSPPTLEKLVGDLTGAYSRRVNIQHRLVYQALDEERVVKVLRMWTHYE